MNVQRFNLRFCCILAGVGLAYFAHTSPAQAQTNLVTLVHDGAWIWFNDPRAVVHSGILYFGHVRSIDGRSALSAFNPVDGSSSNLWTSSSAKIDDHFNPALLVRQDGRILVTYSRHGADPFFSYRISSSTNPVSATDWGPEQRISAIPGGGVSYANPHELAHEGKIFNFCRGLDYSPTVWTSTDGGSNWSAPRIWIQSSQSNKTLYVKYASDERERIDFIYSDGHPRDFNTSLYHLFYRHGAFYKSDGAFLKDFSDIPLQHESGGRGAVIYQSSDLPTTNFDDHIPGGRAWPWQTAYQANGNPVCVFSVHRPLTNGTNWQDERLFYYYARWDGARWQRHFIAQGGRPLYSRETDYAAGLCIDPDDPDVVYISSDAANPFDLASIGRVPLRTGQNYELYRGVTTNGGLTFDWTAVTTNSTVDNLRPFVPGHHGSSMSVLWMRGIYSTYASYNCAIVGLFSHPAATRERPEFESRLWRTEDGLPHNSVQAITQTRDGFLWVGTRQGLVQFDGIHFQPIPELADVPITALCEDNDGALWIGTDGAGVQSYRHGHLVAFNEQTNSPDNAVRSIFSSRKGVLWMGTTRGLSLFRNGKWINVYDKAGVQSICEDQDGNLLVATSQGWIQYRDGRIEDLPGARKRPARAIRSGRDGVVWLGGNEGLERVGTTGRTISLKKSSGLASDIVNTIYTDASDRVWIGTAGGLNYLGKNGEVHEIRHEGELLDLVYSICEDREGDLWVGARDGLHRLNVKYFTTFSKQHGLANNDVTSVLQDATGRMWIGTWGGGLHVMTSDGPDEGTFYRVASTNQYFNDLVLGLFADRSGNIWLGTDFDGGMFRYEAGQFIRYWKGQGVSLLADPAVRAILLDSRKGRVWVGTRDALNVAYRGKPFVRYTTENGISGNSVQAIVEDNDGNVWVGTTGGLTEFIGEQLTNFTTKEGLSHNNVCALYRDPQGSLWIGTAGGGLNRFRDGKFTAYDTHRGLFSDEVLEIVEDNFNRLWMSCRAGIFWVSKDDINNLDAGVIKTLRCVSYGREDGLLSVTCNNIAKPSACKSVDGRLWFATVKGLSVVDPASVPDTHNRQPPIVIQEVLFDGKTLLTATNQLKLPPGRGELEFHFTTLSFRGSERDRFKYRLEGVDHDWTDAGPRRFAHYNNIFPGSYQFRVIACNSDGVWNETGATLGIALQPHYWQTNSFKVCLVLAAGLIAYSIYKFRIDRVRELERLRMRIAADLHDEIGSSMGSISLLTRKIQKEGSLGHEQKNDLASINRISTQAGNSIREIVWFVNPQYDTMQDLALRMHDTARTMLGGMELAFAGPRENLSRKLSLDFRRNIFLIFKEILGNVAKHSRATAVEIVLSEKMGVWELIVSDNGIGFDPASTTRGNGLQNLHRRALRLGGALSIRSRPGHGTVVTFYTKKL